MQWISRSVMCEPPTLLLAGWSAGTTVRQILLGIQEWFDVRALLNCRASQVGPDDTARCRRQTRYRRRMERRSLSSVQTALHMRSACASKR